jgi:aconitate hydratase
MIVYGMAHLSGTDRAQLLLLPEALLGVRAVIARSFERIHRTNLIGMGVLPIVLDPATPISIGLQDRIEVDATTVVPGGIVSVAIQHADKQCTRLVGIAAVQTQREVEILQAGGMIQAILLDSF